jgi:ubiquinone/menaquinone biosynthesis C-methylase UbiE
MPFRLSPTTLLTILQPWADVNEPIHRRLAQLSEIESGQEVLWVGCGTGAAVLWWAKKYQTHVAGVDPDRKAIEAAERTAREAGLAKQVTFQGADPVDLPHEAQVFDITIVHMLQLLRTDGDKVIREAARVARPMSTVMALVPSWLRAPDEVAARTLASIGLVPRLLVEWKSVCRGAGLVELTVENAARDSGWLAAGWVGLLLRGWRAAKWTGVGSVMTNEFRTLRSLALHRVLGLSIIKGTRWPYDS